MAGEDAENRAGLQREAAAEGLGQHPDRKRARPHADRHDADRQRRQCRIGGENGACDTAGRHDHAGVAAGERLRHREHQRVVLRQPVIDAFGSGLGQDRHGRPPWVSFKSGHLFNVRHRSGPDLVPIIEDLTARTNSQFAAIASASLCPAKRNFASAPRSLMSLRAELLRLSLKTLKAAKKVRKPRNIPPEKVRRRLKLLEPVVPRAPSGTKTTIIDIDGINAVETVVRHARTDCCVLYFHGGGYAFGTEPLVRDFTWRLGAAAGASVLYFDYRLAPEHPFPAAVEDAGKVYRWLARRMDPSRIVFVGDSCRRRPCLRDPAQNARRRPRNAARGSRHFPLDGSRIDRALAAYQRQGRSDDGRETSADFRGALSGRR